MTNEKDNPFDVESGTEVVVPVPIRAGISVTASVTPAIQASEVPSPEQEDARLAATFDAIQTADESGKPRRVTIRAKVV
jgi:hypothetical protein